MCRHLVRERVRRSGSPLPRARHARLRKPRSPDFPAPLAARQRSAGLAELDGLARRERVDVGRVRERRKVDGPFFLRGRKIAAVSDAPGASRRSGPYSFLQSSASSPMSASVSSGCVTMRRSASRTHVARRIRPRQYLLRRTAIRRPVGIESVSA